MRLPVFARSCRLGLQAVVVAAALLAGLPVPDARANPFMAATRDRALIEAALLRETPLAAPPDSVTGVTVPHHLLAADLIVRGIRLAASRADPVRHIILVSPDHYRAHATPFAVTTHPISTVMGDLGAAPRLHTALRRQPDLFADAGIAPKEHGVHSITPFIAALMPGATVTAITAASHATPEDWARATAALAPLVADPETLIIQSTDYSHHLPLAHAVARDQETLAAFSSGDPAQVDAMSQPNHWDSSAAQFIMMALQRDVLGAEPVIVANRNSAEYGTGPSRTTSYVTAVWLSDPAEGGGLRYPDHDVLWFGGDVMTGRGLIPLLGDETALRHAARPIRATTGGARLIANLEGVMLAAPPAGMRDIQHWLPPETTLSFLDAAGIDAVSLANNHSYDFGPEGLAETAERLVAHQIAAMPHGKVHDLGPVRVLPLTFRHSYHHAHAVLRSPAEVAAACAVEAEPPLVVFAHWGPDYENGLDATARAALQPLADCGVVAVIGAHSHHASTAISHVRGGAMQVVASLGNLLFDQRGPNVSGALVEMRVFAQSTVALRLVALPNIYATRLDAQHNSRPKGAMREDRE